MKNQSRALAGVGQVTVLRFSETNSIDQGIVRSVREQIEAGITENGPVYRSNTEGNVIHDWDRITELIDEQIEYYKENNPMRYCDIVAVVGWDGIKAIALARLQSEAAIVTACVGLPEGHSKLYADVRAEQDVADEAEWNTERERSQQKCAKWHSEMRVTIAEKRWFKRNSDKTIAKDLGDELMRYGVNAENTVGRVSVIASGTEYEGIVQDTILEGDVKRIRSFVRNIENKGKVGEDELVARMGITREFANGLWVSMISLV